MAFAQFASGQETVKPVKPYRISISKQTMQLTLYDANNQIIKRYPIACGAYGPYFIRLLTPPHRGIGIHGTHAPESIGTRATEGCIRMNNDDLRELRPYVEVGMKVEILTSEADKEASR